MMSRFGRRPSNSVYKVGAAGNRLQISPPAFRWLRL